MKKTKAKRIIKNFNFEGEGAAVALVGPATAGAANGKTTLLIKANDNFSEEMIEKMQQVKVTMELPAFLERFFHLYGTDAQVLARMMGYVPEEKEESEVESYEDYYENLIQEKLESFEIIKSLYLADSLPDAISKITGEQYLKVLEDQVKIEKALKEQDTDVEVEKVSEVEPAPVKAKPMKKSKINKEDKMSNEATDNVEVIEKAQYDAIEKAMQEQKELLQKALDEVATYKAEKQEMIRKARLGSLTEIVKDEKKVEVLFKALNLVEDAGTYSEILEVLKSLMAATETSEMFIEKGAAIEKGADADKSSLVAKRLKAKYKKD